MTQIKIRNRRAEYARQFNLRNSWKELYNESKQIQEFLNSSSQYNKENFDWDMYINQLHATFKSILTNNNVTLRETPYRLIQPSFNKLDKLDKSENKSDILIVLNELIYVIVKNCQCV